MCAVYFVAFQSVPGTALEEAENKEKMVGCRRNANDITGRGLIMS